MRAQQWLGIVDQIMIRTCTDIYADEYDTYVHSYYLSIIISAYEPSIIGV